MQAENRPILLVDDNPNDVFLTQRALRRSNIANEIVVAHDGEEALAYLFGTGKHKTPGPARMPVLTLLDLKMPRMDGLETLKAIRANPTTKLLAVVVLTASREDRDIIESYELGCNAYVRKPVDFDQFTDAVHQLGLFWLVLNEAPPLEG